MFERSVFKCVVLLMRRYVPQVLERQFSIFGYCKPNIIEDLEKTIENSFRPFAAGLPPGSSFLNSFLCLFIDFRSTITQSS